ncbi:MAG: NUDIX hydrolase [Pseudomonadota bacterium]
MSTNETSAPPMPRPGVSVMVFKGDQVLLGQRGKPPRAGLWSLPGGRIEPGETVVDGGARELFEETGVRARIKGVVAVRDSIERTASGDVAWHYVLSILVAEWDAGHAIAASDCVAVRWSTVAELDGLAMTEGTAALIRDVAALRRDPGSVAWYRPVL